MITDQESFAILSDFHRVEMVIWATAPEGRMKRCQEILAETALPYRLILERFMVDLVIGMDKTGKPPPAPQAAQPKSGFEFLVGVLKDLPRGVRLVVLAVVLPLVALFTLWKSLPGSAQSTVLELVWSRPKGMLAVNVESAGPVQVFPDGEYAFPLALRVQNPGDAPVHLEPGVLVLGERSEPSLTGLVLFKTSTLGAHAARQESFLVELMPLRPDDLPALGEPRKAAARIPAGWLRLPVVGAGGREETLTCELGAHSFHWISSSAEQEQQGQ